MRELSLVYCELRKVGMMSVTIGETEKFVDKMMRVKLETGGITLKMMGRLQKTDREIYSISPDWGNDNKIFFSQSDIKEIRVFMPDKERLDSFENLANSIFAKINSNQKQIQLLQKLRDTLLPKLISGEIRIKM